MFQRFLVKPDPYATKLHKRINALLLIFAVVVFVLVLRASAHGQTFRGAEKISDQWAEDDWWVERATVFFPRYRFTLESTRSEDGSTAWSGERASVFFPRSEFPLVLRSALPARLSGDGSDRSGFLPGPNAITGSAKDFFQNTDMTSGSNYSPSGAPTNTDDVRITRSSTTDLRITGGNVTMESLSVDNGNTYAIRNATGGATSRNLTLGNSAGFTNTFSGVANDLIYLTGSSILTIQGPNTDGGTGVLNVVLASTGNFNIGTGSTLTVSSIISESGGSRAITKTGGGTAILSGANTFTGGVTINAGTLRAGSTTTLGPAASATLTFGSSSTGKFQLNGFDTTIIHLNTLGGTDAIIENGATGAATLTDNSTGPGGDAFAGILQNGSTGTLSLTKSGTNILLLLNKNTYTGNTTVNNGELEFLIGTPGIGGSSDSSTILLGGSTTGATLSMGDNTGGNTLLSPLTVQSGTGLRILASYATSNSNTYGGSITLNQGLTLRSATGGTLVLNGTTLALGANALTMDDNSGNVNTQGNVTISDQITGTGGSIVKNGPGTLLLQNVNNTYTGGTQIGGGTVGIVNDLSLGAVPGSPSNNVQFTGSATLQDTSNNVSLATNRNISVANGATATFNSNGNTFTINGVINNPVGNGNIAKSGAGSVVLTGANTYTGTTAINAGTLNLDNNNTTTARLAGTSGITVNSGGTLLLSQSGGTASNDRINDSATMTLNGGTFNSGGLSEHGASNNTAGIGAVTLQSSSIIDMGNVASIIAFANSLAQAASWIGSTISIYDWSGIPVTGNGTDQLYFGSDSTGLSLAQLADFQFYSGFGTGAFTPGAAILTTGEVVPLSPVPEPSTWLAAALALGAVAYTQRRRLRGLVKIA